jgi:protein TonB
MEALAAFADETPLVPVAAFARRRHLFRRMRLIAREAAMSSRRIAWSCTVMAVVVAAGSWYAVAAFPLTETAQDLQNEVGPLEKQAKPITPENPIPRRTYSVDPVAPLEATAVEANAMVTLMITLDQFGRVAEIRRLGVAPIASARSSATPPDPQTLTSAYDSLVRSAADAVRQWTYDPPAEAPLSIRVTFAFAGTGKPRLVAHDGWSLASPGQFVGFGVIGGRGGAPGRGAPPPPPPPPPPPSDRDIAPAPWATGAIRVGGAILQPTKTKHVNPMYPALAQSAGVQGVVILEALIGTEGKVTNARVLRSVPLLDQAALDAVMQWEFTPTRLNGQPVPVLMTMTVQFTLT